MTSKRILLDLAALLFSTALFLVANGLQGTLLGIRAGIEGFSNQTLGLVMTAYFIGYLVGARYIPKLVEKVGHIRVFTTCATLASISSLLHGYTVDPWVWGVLRVITGFALYGLYVVVESWINSRAEKENRGTIFATYMVVNLGALALGQFVLNFEDPATIGLFIIASVFFSLAIIPVCLTRAIQPDPIQTENMSPLKLFKISPLGGVGLFFTGVSNSAFWGMSGVYAYNQGLATDQIASFIALIILGGMAFQAPVGWLSDRFDRRLFIVIVSVCLSLSSLIVFGVGTANITLFYVTCFIFGGFLLTLTSICTSHINDIVDPKDLVPASSAILLTYGLGAIAGPSVVSFFMDALGNWIFFIFIALAQSVVVGFGLYRMKVGEKLEDGSTAVSPVLPMNPHFAEFDPRFLEDAEGKDI